MSKNVALPGLWAIILGGSSGFGFATAEKLARQGMNIAVLYRETSVSEKLLLPKLEKIASENSVSVLPYNINALSNEGREKFIEKFSSEEGVSKHQVKLLLHSIARGNLKPLAGRKDSTDELSAQDIGFTSYAMATSLLDWTRTILDAELFHPDARIVGLTSEGAHKHWQGYAAVSVAKASLESLASYMAVEFAPFGLKTNLIQAGITETSSLKMIPGSAQLLAMAASRNPMGRMTLAQDVAGVIYLLCTEEAFWINGALIHVDGGEHCR